MPSFSHPNEPLSLKARYVFPVAGEPIPGGVVTIRGPRIVAVGHRPEAGEVRDLRNVAILPGLINAHTHLEFSNLAEPLGEPGVPLADWVGEVVRFRQSDRYAPGQAVRLGLQECLASGTTALGEIAQVGWQAGPFETGMPDATVFLEWIGLTAERMAQNRIEAERHLAVASSGWRPGLSPHAPYSVHPALVHRAVALSAERRVPVAMHLAESREEIELLGSARGPLRGFLEDLGIWNPAIFPPGRRPLDYLRALAEAHRALVVHGNYLDDEEIAFLAEHRDTMTVVYCPRTHAFFGHAEHPLPGLLSAGARVALGTDSRASSPDLSLLAEMRFVARRFPQIARRVVLSLGTRGGARALGRDHELGTLEPGMLADLAVVALPDRDVDDPHDLLFDSEEPVVATWCRGRPFPNGPPHRDVGQ